MDEELKLLLRGEGMKLPVVWRNATAMGLHKKLPGRIFSWDELLKLLLVLRNETVREMKE
jgi:hypothetical protein